MGRLYEHVRGGKAFFERKGNKYTKGACAVRAQVQLHDLATFSQTWVILV